MLGIKCPRSPTDSYWPCPSSYLSPATPQLPSSRVPATPRPKRHQPPQLPSSCVPATPRPKRHQPPQLPSSRVPATARPKRHQPPQPPQPVHGWEMSRSSQSPASCQLGASHPLARVVSSAPARCQPIPSRTTPAGPQPGASPVISTGVLNLQQPQSFDLWALQQNTQDKNVERIQSTRQLQVDQHGS